MARGNLTEEELAAGIKAVGVLAAVAGPHGQRRDNPFAAQSPAKSIQPSERAARPPRPVELPTAPKTLPPHETPAERAPGPPIEEPVVQSDRYTEEVHVPMTADMRTRVNLLAAELQRRRTEKRVRFTSNTVFRVAIETFLDRFELTDSDHVNSEEELLRLVEQRLDRS